MTSIGNTVYITQSKVLLCPKWSFQWLKIYDLLSSLYGIQFIKIYFKKKKSKSEVRIYTEKLQGCIAFLGTSILSTGSPSASIVAIFNYSSNVSTYLYTHCQLGRSNTQMVG